MNRSIGFLLVVLSLTLVGCTTARPQEVRHSFSFTFEGAQYDIVGTDLPGGNGANMLVLRDESQRALRAVDLDQDGTIDSVLTGNWSLAEAEAVYAAGIAAAKARGKYNVQPPVRYFEIERPEGTYTIQTSLVGDGRARNRFALEAARPFKAMDTDADGVLDRIEAGNVSLQEAQRAYVVILEEAERLGRIERDDWRVLVTAFGRPNT